MNNLFTPDSVTLRPTLRVQWEMNNWTARIRFHLFLNHKNTLNIAIAMIWYSSEQNVSSIFIDIETQVELVEYYEDL